MTIKYSEKCISTSKRVTITFVQTRSAEYRSISCNNWKIENDNTDKLIPGNPRYLWILRYIVIYRYINRLTDIGGFSGRVRAPQNLLVPLTQNSKRTFVGKIISQLRYIANTKMNIGIETRVTRCHARGKHAQEID